jgi:hypothetical protein
MDVAGDEDDDGATPSVCEQPPEVVSLSPSRRGGLRGPKHPDYAPEDEALWRLRNNGGSKIDKFVKRLHAMGNVEHTRETIERILSRCGIKTFVASNMLTCKRPAPGSGHRSNPKAYNIHVPVLLQSGTNKRDSRYRLPPLYFLL